MRIRCVRKLPENALIAGQRLGVLSEQIARCRAAEQGARDQRARRVQLEHALVARNGFLQASRRKVTVRARAKLVDPDGLVRRDDRAERGHLGRAPRARSSGAGSSWLKAPGGPAQAAAEQQKTAESSTCEAACARAEVRPNEELISAPASHDRCAPDRLRANAPSPRAATEQKTLGSFPLVAEAPERKTRSDGWPHDARHETRAKTAVSPFEPTYVVSKKRAHKTTQKSHETDRGRLIPRARNLR